MSRRLRSSLSIGVDLVEFDKARVFYRTHEKVLDQILGKIESDYILRDTCPWKALAVILAAKEAVLKAMNPGAFFGITGFRKIRILPKARGSFLFRLEGDYKKFQHLLSGFVLTCKRGDRFALALCAPEKV